MSKKHTAHSPNNVVAVNNTNSQKIRQVPDLISHIEQDPKYAHLREQAKHPPTTVKQKNRWQIFLNALKELLIADPKAIRFT